MKVVGKEQLLEFGTLHADVRPHIASWLKEAKEAEWETPHDVKARYTSASFLSENHVIFNLKGNCYRLLIQINYVAQVILIKKIGTHSEYSRWAL